MLLSCNGLHACREPQEIFIVGTFHVAVQSGKDVTQVIETVRPDAVVVELCRSRTLALYDPSEHGASRADREKAKKSLAFGGGAHSARFGNASPRAGDGPPAALLAHSDGERMLQETTFSQEHFACSNQSACKALSFPWRLTNFSSHSSRWTMTGPRTWSPLARCGSPARAWPRLLSSKACAALALLHAACPGQQLAEEYRQQSA